MNISRRRWIETNLSGVAAAGALGALPTEAALRKLNAAPQESSGRALPKAFDGLQPLGNRVHPITQEEFSARREHARKLMASADPALDALYITAGSSSLYYFTGVRWGLSERLMAVLLLRSGDPVVICPAFESDRLHELVKFPAEFRTWEEDESPYVLAAKALAERGLRTGRVGIEERVPFVFYDGLRRAGAAYEYVPASPVTIGCRGQKSPAELELMRLACAATVDCFRAVFASLHEGMTEKEVNGLVRGGFQRMGLEGGALVLFGQWAALPHGTTTPQKLREGDVVLIDGGTSVEGYASDVTRTTVLGTPGEKHRRAFDTVHRAQEAALDAARAGHLSGSVDDAARAAIISAGYPNGYKVFTHRLGHGIGLDGHEHPYLVRGSRTLLAPGMTFSNEPGIYLRGDFGLRLEDDMVITTDGPAQLLTPGLSTSLEKPCG
jgi:Xaa-Pro dipeptidase